MQASKHRGLHWAVAVGILSVTTLSPLHAATLYVSTTGNNANDGLTWPAAKQTVQAALNAATAGDQVWVAAGTYVQCITLKADVALYGGFAGTETDLSQRNWTTNRTILDGNQTGSVVTVPGGAATATRIDGFTIRNGSGTLVGQSPDQYLRGGGIYCLDSSSPTIANNTITGNKAAYGGGIYSAVSCSPVIAHNTIIGNNTSFGGGIYCLSGSPIIANNTITGNIASGIYAGGTGGGILCSSTTALIANNIITGNIASGATGSSRGGGVFCGSSPTITNNTIAGNSAFSGGGIYCYSGTPTIANTIIAFNSSGLYKSTYSDMPSLRCNCVYANGEYDYSGLPDPVGANGNISLDPRLAGVLYGNVHLQPDSPCVDSGDDDSVQAAWMDMDTQARVGGTHVDIGADESDGTVWPAGPLVIVRVAPDGNDTNDGSSWGLAKRSVQAAIETAAATGGEVWVKAATYQERITLRNNVHLYGGFAGTETERAARDWSANVTVLDGSQAGSVVTAKGIGYQLSTVDGFTIRNGRAASGGGIYCYPASPMIANDTITGNTASYDGGGIYCTSRVTIRNNTITGNTASRGGGISCYGTHATIVNNTITGNNVSYGSGGGIYCYYSPATIAHNTITGNTVTGGPDRHGGGGIYCSYSSATITNNIIDGNSAGDYYAALAGGIYCDDGTSTIMHNTITRNIAGLGGGIYCYNGVIASNTITDNISPYNTGGGIYCSSNATIAGNTIARNYSGFNGGGIFCATHASPVIVGNTITGNSVLAADGGGGVCCWMCSATVANNTITGNTVTGSGKSGGGIFCNSGAPSLLNNTIACNSAAVGGGIACWNASGITIANTILAFNSSGIYLSGPSGLALRYTCVYANTAYNFSGLPDPTGTNGNISADPRFVRQPTPGPDGVWGTPDDDYGDLRLQPGSPCIDAGNNADVPPDSSDLDADGNTTEPLPWDLAGVPRFLNDPATPDTGAGPAPIVDIGACEYLCGDINADGHVNIIDLLYFSDSWAKTTGQPNFDPRCDLNADRAVDVLDLLSLAETFGK